ncbi:patatin-like phospholipase family protein [Kitasatospora terrestris]|uniref:Patatin-like phospholipase family protein n=1 Tax=Kitasatospora terrestris TaxID=258051 RepID=A0ABP9DMI6_9ACTN
MTQVEECSGEEEDGARGRRAVREGRKGRTVGDGRADTDGPVRRGLVLGGGGMLGAAWTIGALTAVEEATGWRPGTADVLLGTSAGAILATMLAAGVDVEQLARHQRGGQVLEGPLAGARFDYETAVGGALPPRPRAGIGSPGLLRDAVRHPRDYPFLTMVSAAVPTGRGSVAAVGELVRHLVGADGFAPGSPLRVAAVDYRSGRRVVFGDPGAPRASVCDAVMASCAIPGWFAPVEVGGSRYVDGGCWSATNADLLAGRGLDEVYVLAPMALRPDPGGRRGHDRPRGALAQLVSRYRRAVNRQLLREARELRADGVRVRLLAPTPADLAVMGPNMMDPARREATLEAALETARDALRATR